MENLAVNIFWGALALLFLFLVVPFAITIIRSAFGLKDNKPDDTDNEGPDDTKRDLHD